MAVLKSAAASFRHTPCVMRCEVDLSCSGIDGIIAIRRALLCAARSNTATGLGSGSVGNPESELSDRRSGAFLAYVGGPECKVCPDTLKQVEEFEDYLEDNGVAKLGCDTSDVIREFAGNHVNDPLAPVDQWKANPESVSRPKIEVRVLNAPTYALETRVASREVGERILYRAARACQQLLEASGVGSAAIALPPHVPCKKKCRENARAPRRHSPPRSQTPPPTHSRAATGIRTRVRIGGARKARCGARTKKELELELKSISGVVTGGKVRKFVASAAGSAAAGAGAGDGPLETIAEDDGEDDAM